METICAVLAFFDAHNGAITALATIIIAIFTIVLAGVTRRQAGLTKAALITTERAFVFLEELEPGPGWSFNEPKYTRFIVRPRWRNNGTTPTKNMVVSVNWTPIMGNLPEGFGYEYGDNAQRMFLGPQATEWSAPLHIDPDEMTAAMGGDRHIFIWGRVEYRDVFDDTLRHHTRWCYKIHFELNGRDLPSTQFIAWGDYNGSDHDSKLIS